jgi:hypothetical protein
MWHPDDPSQNPSVPITELTLHKLRAYREALRNEADRVSYWRRVAHGRIDLLAEQQRSGAALTHQQLTKALADTGTGRNRAGLMTIEAAEPLPDLPELDEVWSAHVDPNDDAAAEEFLGRLRVAEQQLNDYRNALHRRVDEATAELIKRYRDNPVSALELIGGKDGGAGR